MKIDTAKVFRNNFKWSQLFYNINGHQLLKYDVLVKQKTYENKIIK